MAPRPPAPPNAKITNTDTKTTLGAGDIRKTLRTNHIEGEDAEAIVANLPPNASLAQVRKAMDGYRKAQDLRKAGYPAELVHAVIGRWAAKPDQSIGEVLQDINNANPDLRQPATDAAKAAGVTLAPPGAENPAAAPDAGFHGNGGDLSSLADDSFLNALRSQARNFLTAGDLQYLAAVGTPDEFLTAMVKSEGSEAAQRALYEQTHGEEAKEAGLTPEGTDFAATAKVAFDPSDRMKMSPPSGGRITSRVDPGSPAAATLAQSTGKSVTEAVRYIRDMNPEDLTNLQRKLVEAGYFAQVMSGSGFEPEVWGDPTDPATNAAWKALLRDTIAQKTDVATLLNDRTAKYHPQIEKLRSEKAKEDERKALAEALQNQVTVTDAASLRVAATKIASATDMTGKDLAPAELDALASWIQGLQATTQRAAKHGASQAVDVDPVAQMTERIAAEHPVDVMGQRVANQADELARLLRGPGA